MPSKIIGMNEDKGTTSMVCDCGGASIYQSEWDRLFDTYDNRGGNSFDMIYQEIYKKDNQPKYICESCSLEVFVLPNYAVK